MNYYDYIFIGASIPCLLSSTTINRKKNILIIEKDKYFGGAWRIDSDIYKNIDLVGHLIVPINNIKGKNIINYFKNINLELNFINKNDFLFETESYAGNGKNGKPIIAKNGWTDFYFKIINFVKSFKNIKIINNVEVKKIIYTKNNIILNCQKSIFICNKLIFPMYCNINKIYYNNTSILIPYKKIMNTHVLLDISYQELNINKNYQSFLDKEPIGVFDRVSVSKIYNNKLILSCRISKNYKNLHRKNIEKLFLLFLIKKNILNKLCKINNIYYYDYNCSYRDNNDRIIINNACGELNKIYNDNKLYILNTIYMGHFLEEFIENKLNI